jgi:hypothetical protein
MRVIRRMDSPAVFRSSGRHPARYFSWEIILRTYRLFALRLVAGTGVDAVSIDRKDRSASARHASTIVKMPTTAPASATAT